MCTPTPETRSLFRRLLFQDTLDQLFRCRECGATLVGAICTGLVRDGRLIDVTCPQCHTVWDFVRIPAISTQRPQLTRQDLAILNDQVPAHFLDP